MSGWIGHPLAGLGGPTPAAVRAASHWDCAPVATTYYLATGSAGPGERGGAMPTIELTDEQVAELLDVLVHETDRLEFAVRSGV